ncbi:MAG: hypothetical protein R3F11_15865 [Verrucomicrobiales bacterium]
MIKSPSMLKSDANDNVPCWSRTLPLCAPPSAWTEGVLNAVSAKLPPSPASGSVTVPIAGLLVASESVAARAPAADGLNVTLTARAPPGGTGPASTGSH